MFFWGLQALWPLKACLSHLLQHGASAIICWHGFQNFVGICCANTASQTQSPSLARNNLIRNMLKYIETHNSGNVFNTLTSSGSRPSFTVYTAAGSRATAAAVIPSAWHGMIPYLLHPWRCYMWFAWFNWFRFYRMPCPCSAHNFSNAFSASPARRMVNSRWCLASSSFWIWAFWFRRCCWTRTPALTLALPFNPSPGLSSAAWKERIEAQWFQSLKTW